MSKRCDALLERIRRAAFVGQSDYRSGYLDRLCALVSCASDAELAVCQAWHGDDFGVPGHGGVDFVASALERAKVAVRVTRECSSASAKTTPSRS